MSINRLNEFLECVENIRIEEDENIKIGDQNYKKREAKKNKNIKELELNEKEEDEETEALQQINDEFMIFKEIRTLISNVDQGTDELNILTVEAMSSTQDRSGNTAMFERLSRVQNRAIITLKSTLDELMRNSEFRSDETLEGRIQRNLTNFLVSKFSECAQRYQTAVTRHSDEVKRASERRLKIMFPELCQKRCVEESDGTKPSTYLNQYESMSLQEQVLVGIITNERGKEDKDALTLDGVNHMEALHFSCAELKDKLKDVRTLEKGVQELHAMFVDLAAMVEQGQDYTNSIELQIMRAVDYSVDTNVALANAKIEQRKRNKRAMRISGVLVVVIVVTILISVFTAGG